MATSKAPINITITAGAIWKGILAVLFVALLYYLRDLVLVILTSVVIASAIEPVARWGQENKIPRAVTVIFVYIIIAILLIGVLILFVPPIVNEFLAISNDLPNQLSSFNFSQLIPESLLTGIPSGEGILGGLSFEALADNVKGLVSGLSNGVLGTISTIFGGALSFILILVLSFYLAVQERGIENFLRVVTPIDKEAYLVNLWRRGQEKIGKWLQGQVVLGVLIAVLVYLGLTIFTDVKYALVLALLAGLFEIIPVFGPILAAVPAIILGFAISPTTGLIVILIYIIIQQFENHLIYPLVVTKIVGVPPLLVIIALVVGAKLAGFLGIILSIPASAILVEILHDLEKEKALLMGQQAKPDKKRVSV